MLWNTIKIMFPDFLHVSIWEYGHLTPIRSSLRPNEIPGVFLSTMNAEKFISMIMWWKTIKYNFKYYLPVIPLCFKPLSVLANTIIASPSGAEDTQDLVPLMIQESPSSMATVSRSTTFVPASEIKIIKFCQKLIRSIWFGQIDKTKIRTHWVQKEQNNRFFLW